MRVCLAAAALSVVASVAQAQLSPPKWGADLTAGAFTEPWDGPTGPLIAVDVRRRLGARTSLAATLAGARTADVRRPNPNRYVVDRDWAIVAVGVDVDVLRRSRVEAGLGGKAALTQQRDRVVGTVGTPVPPGFPDFDRPSGGWYDHHPAAILDGRIAYHVAARIAVTARAALLQRVFSDSFFGGRGSFASIGVSLRP